MSYFKRLVSFFTKSNYEKQLEEQIGKLEEKLVEFHKETNRLNTIFTPKWIPYVSGGDSFAYVCQDIFEYAKLHKNASNNVWIVKMTWNDNVEFYKTKEEAMKWVEVKYQIHIGNSP